jgi:hypothetical protein
MKKTVLLLEVAVLLFSIFLGIKSAEPLFVKDNLNGNPKDTVANEIKNV